MPYQYVIMFNDFPDQVCPVGTALEEAEAIAAIIKEDYLSKFTNTQILIRVRAVPTPIAEKADD